MVWSAFVLACDDGLRRCGQSNNASLAGALARLVFAWWKHNPVALDVTPEKPRSLTASASSKGNQANGVGGWATNAKLILHSLKGAKQPLIVGGIFKDGIAGACAAKANVGARISFKSFASLIAQL